MTWKKWVLAICASLLLLLTSGITAFADTDVEIEQLTKARLSEAQQVIDGCLKCHNTETNAKTRVPGQAPYIDRNELKGSVHAEIPCTACHDDVKQGTKPASIVGGRDLIKKVNRNCQKCHSDINKVWEQSVHGKLFQQGKETALCTDCHGSHNIKKPTNPGSMMYGLNSVETCTTCHGEKYKESYEESFHGRAIKLGSNKSATCVSCHGSHAILGPDDPQSSVNKANIPNTCAQCHLKPNANFANGKEHALLRPQGPGMITYWTLKFFTWLTIIVFTLLIIHMELELWRRMQNLKKLH